MKDVGRVSLRTCSVVLVAAWLVSCGSGDEPARTEQTVAATVAEHEGDAPPRSPIAEVAPTRPVLEQVLAYGEGKDTNLEGFLAMPGDAAEPLPGVIVIHDRWGLDDNTKAIARRLAEEGYVALAVDLFGGAKADTPDRAQALMSAVLSDPDSARDNLRQAYEYLDKYAFAPRIGSIGWSLGGAWSLQTALMYPDDLDAMVMYYGEILTNRDELAKINVPMLGFFGADDESIPVRDVQTFRTTLNSLGKISEILIVSGAGHAFANPSSDTYDEKAANESWEETLKFLSRNLKLQSQGR